MRWMPAYLNAPASLMIFYIYYIVVTIMGMQILIKESYLYRIPRSIYRYVCFLTGGIVVSLGGLTEATSVASNNRATGIESRSVRQDISRWKFLSNSVRYQSPPSWWSRCEGEISWVSLYRPDQNTSTPCAGLAAHAFCTRSAGSIIRSSWSIISSLQQRRSIFWIR